MIPGPGSDLAPFWLSLRVATCATAVVVVVVAWATGWVVVVTCANRCQSSMRPDAADTCVP